MNQFSLDKEKIVVDFSEPHIPVHVKNFMPDIYKDGDYYYCILGDGADTAIIAKGKSVQQAMKNWEQAYLDQQHLT